MFGRKYVDDEGTIFRSQRARDEANRLRVEDPEAYRALESWGGTFRFIGSRVFRRRRRA